MSAVKLSGILLTTVSALLAVSSAYALRHPPFVGWSVDQRITSPTAPMFAPQYIRIIDYDPPNGVAINETSLNTAVLESTDVSVAPCNPADPDCTGAQDGTGYKVTFTHAARAEGATTILISVKGKHGGATAYTSFTLRWVSTGSYPPTIEALPNATLQMSATDGTVKYSAMFVIGDLGDDGQGGVKEDLESITADDFTVTSSNTNLLPNSPAG